MNLNQKFSEDLYEKVSAMVNLNYNPFYGALESAEIKGQNLSKVEGEMLKLVNDAIDRAFRAGWQLRTDATALIFDDKR